MTEKINASFNKLSTRARRGAMIILGTLMAAACSIILIQSLFLHPTQSIETVPIPLPKDNSMSAPNQQLIPLGKMKGEIAGEYTSFHVAVDKEGQLFINPDPEFSKDSLTKEKGWEPITRQQLEQYQQQIHFMPAQKRTIKR